MPVEVIMPKVDMDMSSGKIMVWHVAAGERVEKGAPLFDIETDKAAMEVEAPGTGILYHPAEAGRDVPIGHKVAWLYEEGEEVGPAPEVSEASPGQVAPGKIATEIREVGAAPGGKVRATPLARRIAADKGLDLAGITGSGPRGRIGKVDVEAAHAPSADTVRATYAGRAFAEVPLDGMRRTVAARLTEAKQTVPHFYLRRGIRMDCLLELRAGINRQLAERGVKLTVNDFIIKACAAALQQVPDANAAWAGDRLLRFVRSDIAVAVSVEGGLFTPVIRDADHKSLSALSDEMKTLAARARDRKLKPADYTGGSLSISNLGMYGIEEFDAIVNPPQSAILAVGAALKRKVVTEEGAETIATVMRATLSVDHRAIDGVLGARLLGAIVRNLENPLGLLV